MESSPWKKSIVILLFAAVATAGQCEEIPRSFFQTYGLMARSVWASYQKDGNFDIEGVARDSLMQEFYGSFDGHEFATIVAALNQDPFDIFTGYLNSGKAREMAFALTVIMWLGDRRFDRKIEELTASKISMVRELNRIQQPPSNDPFGPSNEVGDKFDECETIGDLAKIVSDWLESAESDDFLHSEAKWLIKARAFKAKAAL